MKMDLETARFRERIYRLRNAELIRSKNAAYRETHREELRAYGRARYAANRERLLAQNAAYRQSHWDEHLATTRRRYWAQRPKFIARSAAYREDNREKTRAAASRWARNHPQRRAHAERMRVIRKRGNGGSHTLEEWLEKKALFGNCCVYCGRDDIELTRDHKMPLSRGGRNDIMNILPACRSCNARKRMRTDREFLGLQEAA